MQPVSLSRINSSFTNFKENSSRLIKAALHALQLFVQDLSSRASVLFRQVVLLSSQYKKPLVLIVAGSLVVAAVIGLFKYFKKIPATVTPEPTPPSYQDNIRRCFAELEKKEVDSKRVFELADDVLNSLLKINTPLNDDDNSLALDFVNLMGTKAQEDKNTQLLEKIWKVDFNIAKVFFESARKLSLVEKREPFKRASAWLIDLIVADRANEKVMHLFTCSVLGQIEILPEDQPDLETRLKNYDTQKDFLFDTAKGIWFFQMGISLLNDMANEGNLEQIEYVNSYLIMAIKSFISAYSIDGSKFAIKNLESVFDELSSFATDDNANKLLLGSILNFIVSDFVLLIENGFVPAAGHAESKVLHLIVESLRGSEMESKAVCAEGQAERLKTGAQAIFRGGVLYYGKKNYLEAFRWFRLVADMGINKGFLNCGKLLINGQVKCGDDEVKLIFDALFKGLAKDSDGQVSFVIGKLLMQFPKLFKGHSTAKYYFEKAHKLGCKLAAQEIILYDYEQALESLSKELTEAKLATMLEFLKNNLPALQDFRVLQFLQKVNITLAEKAATIGGKFYKMGRNKLEDPAKAKSCFIAAVKWMRPAVCINTTYFGDVGRYIKSLIWVSNLFEFEQKNKLIKNLNNKTLSQFFLLAEALWFLEHEVNVPHALGILQDVEGIDADLINHLKSKASQLNKVKTSH